MRKKIIAGNWKMNKTPSEAVALVNELKPLVANEDVDVVFCVPANSILFLLWKLQRAQTSASVLKICILKKAVHTQAKLHLTCLTDVGVKYVIIGHSERREYFR